MYVDTSAGVNVALATGDKNKAAKHHCHHLGIERSLHNYDFLSKSEMSNDEPGTYAAESRDLQVPEQSFVSRTGLCV
jgi:hypothetical protein